jgi:hypothetical protein
MTPCSLKIEAVRSFETFVTTYRTAERYNPGDHDPHLHCRETSNPIQVVVFCFKALNWYAVEQTGNPRDGNP